VQVTACLHILVTAVWNKKIYVWETDRQTDRQTDNIYHEDNDDDDHHHHYKTEDKVKTTLAKV
jgi:hypothetical protein